MSLEVSFNKAKASHLRECLQKRQPIEGIRTVDDLVMLAGACFFTLVFRQPTLERDRDWSRAPVEHQEAAFESMLKELLATIEHCGHLFMHLGQEGEVGSLAPVHRFRASLEGGKVNITQIEENKG